MTKERLWKRDYTLLVITGAFQNLQNQMVNPIMARFCRQRGIDIGTVGVIVGIFSVAALISRPVGGKLSDRYNNKIITAVSALCMGGATLGYVICGSNVWLLLFFRFLHGLFFGVCGTTLMRMASCLVPPSRLGEGMGYFGMGQVLSVAIGPAAGLFLAQNFGYHMAFVAGAVIICAVSGLCLFITMPKTEKTPRKALGRFRFSALLAPEAVVFSVVACTLFFAGSAESNFVILYGEELGLRHLWLYFALGAAVMLVTRLITGRVLDKKGLTFVLVPALLCVGVAMALLAAAGAFPFSSAGIFLLFLAASVVKAVGHSSTQPALQAACVRSVTQDRRGLASATFYMGSDLGMALGPVIGGALVGAVGFPGLYLISAGVVVLGLLVFLFFKNRTAHSKAPQTPQ